MADDIRLQLSHLLQSSDYLLGGKSLAVSDSSHIEQLAPIIKSAIISRSTEDVIDELQAMESTRENEIRSICEDNDNPFLEASEYLENIRGKSQDISQTVDLVASQIERSGKALVEQSSTQVNMNRTRRNIESALATTRTCLQALEHTNQVHQLLKSSHRVAAVQSLHELQAMGLDKMRHFDLTNMISRAVPALTKLIVTTTFKSVDEFTDSLDKRTDALGSKAYSLLAEQRKQWEMRVASRRHLQPFRFNSPVELAYRESGENFFADAKLELDLGPLYEAELVFSKLHKIKDLSDHFEAHRQKTSATLIPQSTREVTPEILRAVTGFCVSERVISHQLPRIRQSKQVDDLWEQLARSLSEIISGQIPHLKHTSELTPFKDMLSTFMETMENFGFNVGSISTLLRDLLAHFSAHLVSKSIESFHHSWKKDDHMAMVINKPDLYETIMSIVWYDDPNDANPKPYPRVLPFSEIYPLTCADLRSLITHHNSFFDQFQRSPAVVEDTLLAAVDKFLTDTVCREFVKCLEGNIKAKQHEVMVQVLVNLEYFEYASRRVQTLLESLRMSGRRGRVVLKATEAFEDARKLAESRIFEYVEMKIDESFETMERPDWHTQTARDGPAGYALDMAQFLMSITNSTLTRVPPSIRPLVFLAMGDHLNVKLLQMLETAPDGISKTALDNFQHDVDFIETSVMSFSDIANNPSLATTLTEVSQVVTLMRSDDLSEYNNPQVRMRKYDRVDAGRVTKLLSKVQGVGTPVSSPRPPQGFMRYLQGEHR